MPPATGSGCREGVSGERTEVTLHPAQSPGRALQARERGQHVRRLGTCRDHVWCVQHDPKVGTDPPVRHAAWLCVFVFPPSALSVRESVPWNQTPPWCSPCPLIILSPSGSFLLVTPRALTCFDNF